MQMSNIPILFVLVCIVRHTAGSKHDSSSQSCGDVFRQLLFVCLEKRDCKLCRDLFSVDATKLAVAQLGILPNDKSRNEDRHSTKQWPTRTSVRDLAYETCERLKTKEHEAGTRLVVDLVACGGKDNHFKVVVTLYVVPNLMLASSDLNHWKEMWLDTTKGYDTAGSKQLSNLSGKRLPASMTTAHEVQGDGSSDQSRLGHLAQMRDIAERVFGSPTPPILCSQRIGFHVRFDPHTGKILEWLDIANLKMQRCCGVHCMDDNNKHDNSSNTVNTAKSGLLRFWQSLTDGSCARAVRSVSDTFTAVFDSLDFLKTMHTFGGSSHGPWQFIAAKFEMTKDTLLAGCQHERQLGIHLQLSDLFWSSDEGQGIALIDVAGDLHSSETAATKSLINLQHVGYQPYLPTWQSAPLRQKINLEHSEKENAILNTSNKTREELAVELQEEKKIVDDVWKSIELFGKHAQQQAKALLHQIVEVARGFINRESRLDPETFNNLSENLKAVLDRQNETLTDFINQTYGHFRDALQQTKAKIDSELDKYINEISGGSDRKENHVENAEISADAKKDIDAAISDFREQLEDLEKTLHTQISAFRHFVGQGKGSWNLPTISTHRKRELSEQTTTQTRPQTEAKQKTQKSMILSSFNTNTDGYITHVTSMKTEQFLEGAEDLELRLFGLAYPILSTPSSNLTPARWAVSFFLPIFMTTAAVYILCIRPHTTKLKQQQQECFLSTYSTAQLHASRPLLNEETFVV